MRRAVLIVVALCCVGTLLSAAPAGAHSDPGRVGVHERKPPQPTPHCSLTGLPFHLSTDTGEKVHIRWRGMSCTAAKVVRIQIVDYHLDWDHAHWQLAHYIASFNPPSALQLRGGVVTRVACTPGRQLKGWIAYWISANGAVRPVGYWTNVRTCLA
jgi:hypothetical protein